MSNLQRDAILAQVQTILQKPNLSREDSSRAENLLALADRCGEGAMRLRRAAVGRAELELGIRSEDNSADPQIEADFRNYLRFGREHIPPERRALDTGTTGSAGGFLVPATFREQLEIALRAYDGLFGAATIWQSSTGSAIDTPILTDTNSQATVIAENALVPDEDIGTFDTLSFGKCPSWKTGFVKVSRELAQDSYFDISAKLAEAFAVRFGRGIGQSFVTTLLSSADVGATTASSSAIAATELLDLVSAIDPAYWAGASFCMNKNTFVDLMKLGMLDDAAGQSITMWTARDLRLFDKPILICPSMPDIGSSTKPVGFGDFGKFLRREVINSLRVKQYNERFIIDSDSLGFCGFWRVDGGLLKPSGYGSPVGSDSPIKLLQMHS